MADVWGAVDVRLHRPVAVKVLRADLAARPELRVRFTAEARSAAGLSHPHAVAVYDTGEFAGRPYLVMERLPGRTLADRIAAGPVDPAWLRQVMVDVLGALGAAHAAGIVHRDVKPGNILLTDDGRAKMADFGIAKSVEVGGADADLTATGHLVGTPAYLAPERIDGRPATPQTDLYGLGVVAYEALTGERPFPGDSPLAVALAVTEGRYRRLSEARPDLDPALVAAVERAMAPDPGQRFASAADMARALEGGAAVAAAAPTVEVPAPGTRTEVDLDVPIGTAMSFAARPSSGRARRQWRRRFWLLLALAALVGLALRILLGGDGNAEPSAGVPTTRAGPATTAAPPTTVARATTTTRPATTTTTSVLSDLDRLLRDLAERLTPRADGRRSGNLSSELRKTAGALGTRDQGEKADDAMKQVAEWLAEGDLSHDAARSALGLLSRVPGAGAPPSTSVPPTTR